MALPTLAVSVTVPLLLLAVNGSQVRLLMAAAALSPTTVAVSPVTSANEKVSLQVSIAHAGRCRRGGEDHFSSKSLRWLPGQHNQTSLTLLFLKKRAIRCGLPAPA